MNRLWLRAITRMLDVVIEQVMEMRAQGGTVTTNTEYAYKHLKSAKSFLVDELEK